MKLKPIVAGLAAVFLSGSAFAAYHQAPVAEKKVERLQSKLDRNHNPYYAQSDWFRRITLSGLVQAYFTATNHDLFVPGLLATANPPVGGGVAISPRFGGVVQNGSGTDIFLSRANLYIDADVNSWTEVHMAFDLANNVPGATHNYQLNDERSYAAGTTQNVFPFPDEAYITMGNFAKSPFYGRVGREYLRFGHYERNVLPATFTQLLSQTQADVMEVGFDRLVWFQRFLLQLSVASHATRLQELMSTMLLFS